MEKIKLDFYNAKTIADIKETSSQNLLREKRELDKNLNDTMKEEVSWKNRNSISINHISELNNRLEQCQLTFCQYFKGIQITQELGLTFQRMFVQKCNELIKILLNVFSNI